MLRKTLLTLSASAMLGAPVIAPNAALAFGPPSSSSLLSLARLLAWLVLLLALDSEALLLTLAWAVLLLASAPVVLPLVSVVLLVSVAVITVSRAMFAVSKAALQPMPMATLHAMATAIVRGETATGQAMAALFTATMAMPLPMATAATPTPTAPGDAPTGGSWFATETERGRLFDCEAAKAKITRTLVPCLIALA